MSILRAMTYALEGCTSRATAEIARLICEQGPELVFLQHLGPGQLDELAADTGLEGFAPEANIGFLSRHPLCAVRYIDLAVGGWCARADLDISGKRLHLFNIRLVGDPTLRGQQLARLFDVDLLGGPLPCASLIAGDFSVPLWGGGQWLLRRRLTLARFASWGANYPSVFPLWPRDRFYLNGPVRCLAGQVVATPAARKLSRHLPLVVSFELTDTREYLKIPEMGKKQMRPVTG